MLIALAAVAVGCASADRPARRDPPREHFVSPVAREGSRTEAADLFGYRAQRERLVLLLEDEADPSEQARLDMELADLAERTRGTALVRIDELESRRDDGAREERDELGRLARKLLDEELERLERVTVDFPDFSRRDEALYRLGCALLERDRPDVALRFLRVLFAEHPASPYTPHGYLAFADHFFDQEKNDEAMRLYEKVIAFGNPEATALAHHKLGWCRLRRGEHQKSLESFVAAAGAAKGLDGPVGIRLLDEVRKDLVQECVHGGAPEKALELFERIDEGKIDEMLGRLGAAYFDAGRFQESIVINRQVSGRVECSPVQARAQVAVFEARLFLGEIDDLKSEGELLVEVFTRLAQCVSSEDLVEFAEAGAAARETLKAQARRYRAEVEGSGEPAAAVMAADLEMMAESF